MEQKCWSWSSRLLEMSKTSSKTRPSLSFHSALHIVWFHQRWLLLLLLVPLHTVVPDERNE